MSDANALDFEQATAALARGDVVIADAQRAAFVRAGEYTLMLPRAQLTKQICAAPFLVALEEYDAGRALRRHIPLRAVPRAPAVATALAAAEKLLDKQNLLDAVVRELRAGRRFMGGATSDSTWTVAWDGTTFVKTGAPDEEGRIEVTHLDESAVRETMSHQSVCGLSRLRPGTVLDEKQEVIVDFLTSSS